MIRIDRISKTYQDKAVLQNFSMELEEGGVYCLMGASGIGKTTLLRILMGLEQPDSSEETDSKCSADTKTYFGKSSSVKCIHSLHISAVFQENRLCDFADAVKNIRLVSGRDGLLYQPEILLEGLLERDAWHKPVSQLSGGMQRRVAVLRALAAKSDFLVMDEPFTGLDPETKERLIKAVLKFRNSRTLLAVTHHEEEAELLGAEIIRM